MINKQQSINLFFFLEKSRYDVKTIQMLTEFVTDCESLLGSNPMIWIDCPISVRHLLTTNTIFKWQHKKMTKEWMAPFPSLSLDSSAQESPNFAYYSSLIPVEKDKWEENCESIIRQAIDEDQNRVILINDEDSFDVQKMVDALTSMGATTDKIFVHTFSANKSFEELKIFLENPTNYLICSYELFSGITTNSITYFFCDKEEHEKNAYLGDLFFDNCYHLTFVYKYCKDSNQLIHFGGSKRGDFSSSFHQISINTNFVKECGKTTLMDKLICRTCTDNPRTNDDQRKICVLFICKSCLYKCHHDCYYWETAHEQDKDDKERKCECRYKSRKCLLQKVQN